MKEQTILRIPANLKKTLKEEAEKMGISLNALITQTLWKHFKNNQD